MIQGLRSEPQSGIPVHQFQNVFYEVLKPLVIDIIFIIFSLMAIELYKTYPINIQTVILPAFISV
jgi:hypothetical protein